MTSVLSDQDFTSARIRNLPAPVNLDEPVRLGDLGASTITSSTVTINAGSFGSGSNSVAYSVTGQTTIASTAQIIVCMRLQATADHTVDDPLIDALQVNAGNIIPGV